MTPAAPPRSIAFYLPQFHPIPENDAWWGDGFTEWVNVRRARPLFADHHQPMTPGELGYYDLRDPQIRLAQADLARSHGVAGFCYYHYWFNGRRLLDAPLNGVLELGEPDFPFMLCWANENWTRAWDGAENDVLLEQRYSVEDDRAHIRYLAGVFEDRRYIRVDGRPVFLIYRAGLLPDMRQTVDVWRDECDRLGVPAPYLCLVESFPDEEREPATLGVDAAVEFAPQWRYLPHWRRTNRVLRGMSRTGVLPRRFGHHVLDYDAVAARMLAKPQRPYRWYRAVTPGWDNTPRRQTGGLILNGSTPRAFESWLAHLMRDGQANGNEFVFINAWNEWGEGCHLEPCERWGRSYLEAHARAVRQPVAGWSDA
jgi:hypothetical protein